jgi:hypothetical protein
MVNVFPSAAVVILRADLTLFVAMVNVFPSAAVVTLRADLMLFVVMANVSATVPIIMVDARQTARRACARMANVSAAVTTMATWAIITTITAANARKAALKAPCASMGRVFPSREITAITVANARKAALKAPCASMGRVSPSREITATIAAIVQRDRSLAQLGLVAASRRNS